MKRIIMFFAVCLVLTLGINAAGTFEYILPTEYTKIEYGSYLVTEHYIKALDKDGKESIFDFNGNKILGGYDRITLYEDGMAVGKRESEYDVINYQGKVMSTFGENFIGLSGSYVLLDLGNNNDGRPVSYYEGEFAVCDYHGNQVKVLPYSEHLPPRNAGYGLSFEASRMVLIRDGKYGAINDGFAIAIEPKYDMIYGFFNDRYSTIAVMDGKYGIIDHDDKVLTPFEYEYIEYIEYSDGNGCYKAQKGEQWCIIGIDGKTVMMELCSYQPARIFYNYSLIEVSAPNTREDKDEYPYLYGLADFGGNIVLPIEHISIDNISDGIIAAKKSYDHGGYYDLFGNEITEFKYRILSEFSEGYAFASSCIDGVWAHDVIDIDGNVVFTAENWSQGFNGGIAYIGDKFIDNTGKVVYTLSEKASSTNNKGVFTVTDGTYYGVIKYKPKEAVPLWEIEYLDFYGEVSTIEKQSGGYVFKLKDGTERYFDLKGNPTDNKVLVYGTSLFRVGDTTEIRDAENNVMMTLKDGEYKQVIESEYEVAVVYENSVTILSKVPSCIRETYDWSLEETAGLAEFYICNIGQYYCKENDGKYYIIGSRTPYDMVWFLGDEFSAKRNGGWYIVDEDGNERNSEPFAETPEIHVGYTDYYVVGSKIYDKNLELVLDLGKKEVYSIVNEKYIIVSDTALKEFCVVNIKGETIIPTTDGHIEYLGNELFEVYRGGLYSVVHASGRVLASDCYYVTDIGDNGYVGISMQDFEGYIDNTGKVKITLPNGYRVQGTFSEGMASVVQGIVYGRYGDTSYINEDGNIVLDSNGAWCYGGDFENKIAFVYTKLGKAGPLGKLLVKCVYNNPSDWAGEIVLMALDKGIIKYEDQPLYRKNITREGFCEIVYELPAVQNALANVTTDAISFTDTDNAAVKSLSALGVIYGKGNGKFDPDAYITREEVATILDRVYRLDGKTVSRDGYTYTDDSTISDWAKESVYNMRAAGIMQGMGNDEFSPKTMCTAEQTVTAAMRLYN